FSELASIFNTVVQRMRQQINQVEQQYQDTQDILQRFLPSEILERLTKKESLIATQTQQVTVLFAKVVGLWQLSESETSGPLTQPLTELLSTFNQAARRSDVEPFKFASDRYIATCGLTKPRLDHEKRMLDFALNLLDLIRTFNSRHQTRLSLRIGIHTGTVETAVLGTQQLSYDLLGEPVVIASSLIDTPESNLIITTPLVRDRLQGFYDFQPGDGLALENRSKIDTWILRKGALTDLIGELTSDLVDESSPVAAKTILPSTEMAENGAKTSAAEESEEVPVPATAPSTTTSSSSILDDLAGELGIDSFDS
ncbi:MAG: adenylate/guanylate cyclase domain-containing protein, partial [Cyanobacteria bacterium P01_C01_bin.120]